MGPHEMQVALPISQSQYESLQNRGHKSKVLSKRMACKGNGYTMHTPHRRSDNAVLVCTDDDILNIAEDYHENVAETSRWSTRDLETTDR